MLVVYGLVGLILIALGGAVGLDLAGRVERLTLAVDETLEAASASTAAAAEAFESVDDSLEEGGSSADGAASLARDAAATLASLSDTMRLTVFGTQPLLPLADDFATSGEQAGRLATALDGVGESLGATRTDLAGIAVELRALGGQLDGLRVATGDQDGSAPPVRLFVILLLAWLAVPAVGSLVVGGAFLRRVDGS